MQGYWSGLPFPSLGDLLYLEISPKSPSLQHWQTPYLLDSEPPGKHIIVCVHVWVCVSVCVCNWQIFRGILTVSYLFLITNAL